MKPILSVTPLSFPMPTLDPFLFAVYHLDNYPKGNDKMEAPKRGNGMDFDFKAPYRMYHGEKVPGFPQHPHRGFETLTATVQGIVDHTDSCGNAGRYGHGDLQWMTAGKGIVHGEMFPLVHNDKPNPLKLFQIWLNLPRKSKMVEPAFTMHWSEEIPKYISEDGKSEVVVWAGEFQGKRGLPPPPDSWATDPQSEVAVWLIVLKPGGKITLPAASTDKVNRALYFTEGDEGNTGNTGFLTIADSLITKHCRVVLQADVGNVTISYDEASEKTAELLLLQGKPIGEPVEQHGPFVMNTRDEIMQAFADYRETRFGGWPWPKDAMVFSKEKGRFALLNKIETYPTAIGKDQEL